MRIDPLVHDLLREISPTDDQYLEAERRARRYAGMLFNDHAVGALDWWFGGSFAKKTATGLLSDVDVILLLDPHAWRGVNGQRYKPDTVLRRLRDLLEFKTTALRQLGHLKRVRKQEHSVRLVYSRRETIDLEIVPAFSTTKPNVLRIPERTSGRWVFTSPEIQSQRLATFDSPNQFLRRAIRLLKHWRTAHRLQLISYAIEVLAIEAVEIGCAKNPSDVLLAVLNDIVRTRLHVNERYPSGAPSGSWVPRSGVLVVDPAIATNNLIENLDASMRNDVIRAAEQSIECLEQAEFQAYVNQSRAAAAAFRAAFTPTRRRARGR